MTTNDVEDVRGELTACMVMLDCGTILLVRCCYRGMCLTNNLKTVEFYCEAVNWRRKAAVEEGKGLDKA